LAFNVYLSVDRSYVCNTTEDISSVFCEIKMCYLLLMSTQGRDTLPQ